MNVVRGEEIPIKLYTRECEHSIASAAQDKLVPDPTDEDVQQLLHPHALLPAKDPTPKSPEA